MCSSQRTRRLKRRPKVEEESAYALDLLINQCDGTFVEAAPGPFDDTPAAMGIDLGDPDLNESLDLYMTDVFQHDFVLHDNGNSLYSQVAPYRISDNIAGNAGVVASHSWGTNFFDADQDGDEDPFVGIGSPADPSQYEDSVLFENRSGCRSLRSDRK